MTECAGCKQPITEYVWRDPTRCVDCYLALKRGAVRVCVENDVRVFDCLPGAAGRVHRNESVAKVPDEIDPLAER